MTKFISQEIFSNIAAGGRRNPPLPAVSPRQAERVSPAPLALDSKLPDGWHDTLKHGPVFVNAGKAWAIKFIGNKLKNMMVDISANDFIGKSVIEKRKESVRKAARRQSTRVSRTERPLQPLQRRFGYSEGD